MILCTNPLEQYQAHAQEIDAAISNVCSSGYYILGAEVQAFEKEFAQYIGVKHAIGVANGTDALILALTACGVGHEDEVVTVSNTAVATVSAIERCGAKPVFVDIEAKYFGMDASKLEAAITPKTKAVIPVHLFGHPVDLKEIEMICNRHKLTMIEDCAQAHGALYDGKKVGSFGEMACFSFYPTKNLGALGDGGMVVTNNQDLFEKVKLLQQYGWKKKFISEISGWNSRLDELQAAILRVKLRHLDSFNSARREIAKAYHQAFHEYPLLLPEEREDSKHVYHLYVTRSEFRDHLLQTLLEKKIGVGIHYPVPIHLQSAYLSRFKGVSLPETEKAAQNILSFPMYPELLSNKKLSSAIDTIKDVLGSIYVT